MNFMKPTLRYFITHSETLVSVPEGEKIHYVDGVCYIEVENERSKCKVLVEGGKPVVCIYFLDESFGVHTNKSGVYHSDAVQELSNVEAVAYALKRT